MVIPWLSLTTIARDTVPRERGSGSGRRRPYLEHWAPLHNMTLEEATEKFPREARITRYGEPEDTAELMAFLVSPQARWMTGSTLRMDGGEVKSV